MVKELKLDLACGVAKKEGFFGIDILPHEGVDCVMDLQQYPWDIESNSAEEINCSHYAEHIKHENPSILLKQVVDKSATFEEFKKNISSPEYLHPTDDFINFMNEVYRILKPGGKLTIVCPHYMSTRAFGDPTHTRQIGDLTFYYFNKQWRDAVKIAHGAYNCDFDIKYSYSIDNNLTLRSEEYRNKAFTEHWNAINDILAELTKR
jgi:predicted SAM-dependent methyltransferase